MSPASPTPPPRAGLAVTAATVCTVLVVLPTVLLGALAVLVRAELGFDEARLGIAVAVFFGVTALTSAPGGRLGDILGARRAMILGGTMSAGAMASIGLLASNWGHLVAFLALAGVGNGLAQPAANIALAQGVSLRRQGLAFGMKQAAVPIAIFLAGVAIPAVGLTVGWRWAFIGTGVLLLLLVAVTHDMRAGPRAARPDERLRVTGTARRTLLLLAVATGCGAGASSALGTFLVESTVRAGQSLGTASVVLVVGSVCGIAARLLAGLVADRSDGAPLGGIGAMLLLGAAGYLGLAFSDVTVVLWAGTILAFAAGWGWPGLMVLSVVRLHRGIPGAATGVTQSGAAAGGVAGPLIFGFVASQVSFQAAWLAAGTQALIAAGLMFLALRLHELPGDRDARPAPPRPPPRAASPAGRTAPRPRGRAAGTDGPGTPR